MPKGPIYFPWSIRIHFTASTLERICGGDPAYFPNQYKQTCLDTVITEGNKCPSHLCFAIATPILRK